MMKKRFFNPCARVFILRYSWTSAGAWQIMKHTLPQSALKKVTFTDDQGLRECMSVDAIPMFLGGRNDYAYDADSDPFMLDHDDHINDLHTSTVSRTPSNDSMFDQFYSAASSPRSNRSSVSFSDAQAKKAHTLLMTQKSKHQSSRNNSNSKNLNDAKLSKIDDNLNSTAIDDGASSSDSFETAEDITVHTSGSRHVTRTKDSGRLTRAVILNIYTFQSRIRDWTSLLLLGSPPPGGIHSTRSNLTSGWVIIKHVVVIAAFYTLARSAFDRNFQGGWLYNMLRPMRRRLFHSTFRYGQNEL